MPDNLSGGTSNLLRMARTGCQSAVAFVALAAGPQTFATATYPSASEPDGLDAAEVEGLVRQLWSDPGLAQGKSLLRTVQLDTGQPGEPLLRLAVAAVPLGMTAQGHPSGVLGVADPMVAAFGMAELELLARVAQRLNSYVQARQVVRAELRVQPAAPGDRPAAEVLPPAPPPFPPPAGTIGVPRSSRTIRTRPGGAQPAPAGRPSQPEGPVGVADGDTFRALLTEEPEVAGLVPLGTLLGRAGRLLGAGTALSGELAVVALAVDGPATRGEHVVAEVTQALRRGLRFDDPVARIGALSFVAVIPLAPGAANASKVEDHLAGLVRAAVESDPQLRVRSAHVVAPLNGGHEADELLRAAVVKLRAR